MRALIVITALVTGACERPRSAEGEACTSRWQCLSHLSCINDVCRPHPGEGGACDGDRVVCRQGYVCHESTCRTLAWIEQDRAAKQREANRRMIEQSGLDPAQPEVAAEAPVLPPGKGPHVRVSRTDGKGRGFAACRDDERLLSGGCESQGQLRRSAPERYGPQDTMGARWTCEVQGDDVGVSSYALCQAAR